MALLSANRTCRISYRAALLCMCLANVAMAGEPVSLEDTVKAAYVYKFAPFIVWPSQLAGHTTFTICSIGTDRVSALLPQVTEGQRVDDRPIHVRALSDGEAATDCAILYIAAPTAAGPILEAVHGKPILTITTGPGPNGIIQLVTADKHVSFDIDAKLATEDGLGISSKLLGLARNVRRPAETSP